MRYLGIDYGTKRIGLAISDDDGQIAFPKEVVQNSSTIINTILNMITVEHVGTVVVGESLDASGNPNEVMEAINSFVESLKTKTDVPVLFQKEFMTSHHATVQKGKDALSARQSKYEGGESLDASAAALILQRFLDKQNMQK